MDLVHAHGAEIPALGFGSFELAPDEAYRMVVHALELGYRHIDTAQIYRNEEAVGEAIRSSGIPRGDIFLTTKVWVEHYRDGELQASARASLERLGTDYVDLLLLHWPSPDVPLEETIAALNDARAQGFARHIGVSNFTSELVGRAVAASAADLVVNQIEYHPFLDQRVVHETLEQQAMALTAYCPLAQGQVFDDPVLREIGARHGKSGGQVALRWLLQQENVVAIPRSSKPAHVEANLAVFDFELDADEMQRIHALARPDGRIISPEGLAPDWDRAT